MRARSPPARHRAERTPQPEPVRLWRGPTPRARGRIPLRRSRASLTLFPAPASTLGAQQVHRASVGLGEKVGTQRSSARIESIRMVPEAQEHLLGDLFGERLVGEQPPSQAVDGAGVASIRLGEGVLSVARDPDDERGIADVAQRLGVHEGHTLPTAPGGSRDPVEPRDDLDVGGMGEQVDHGRAPVDVPESGEHRGVATERRGVTAHQDQTGRSGRGEAGRGLAAEAGTGTGRRRRRERAAGSRPRPLPARSAPRIRGCLGRLGPPARSARCRSPCGPRRAEPAKSPTPQ